MAQIVVRNIPDELFVQFKERAKTEGKSAEQLAREAIAGAALVEPVPYWLESKEKPSGAPVSKSRQKKSGTLKIADDLSVADEEARSVSNDWQKDRLW